jgi:hypothetical protein
MKPAVLLSVLLLLAGMPGAVSARESAPTPPALQATPALRAPEARRLSDTELLELTQRQTFRYFWDFAHPVSGLARERSNVRAEYGNEVVTTGGSGFGVMAIVVATERGWITRPQAVGRMLQLTAFLMRADRFHGVFPHWMNGATGRVFPFSRLDDGGDIVETAYLFEGLLTARQYFNRGDADEAELRRRIDRMWREVEWTWHVQPGRAALMWNRSPRHGFAVGAGVAGWNEALVTYVLAAGSPGHAIDTVLYHRGWARDGAMRNGREYYGIRLPLGPPCGGPLFFAHYSFMGIDPHGLVDRYADYWQQNVNQALIDHEHCVRNPHHFKGYGANAWGLTSSDDGDGYRHHSPTADDGVLSPTAALASFPYTPQQSMQALRHFHDDLGGRLWGPYGFVDAFNETSGWVASSCLAIDQGPIIVMIENYRTGLPWRLFMSCPEVQAGLRRLGFTSPYLSPRARK